MKYYCSTVTGNFFNETDLTIITDIYGRGAIDKIINDGTLIEIAAPSVVDLLIADRKVLATKRYKEIHNNCSLKEAIDAVNKIEKEMKQLQKKNAKAVSDAANKIEEEKKNAK